MKITHNKIGQNLSLKDTGKKEDVKNIAQNKINPEKNHIESKKFFPKVDQDIDISSRAKVFSQAQEIAKKTPDFDNNKVERIKNMINHGTYKVDSEALAERILKDEFNLSE